MTTFEHIAAAADEVAEETFQRFCESFKTWLSEVAFEHGKPVKQIFAWWQEYTRDCCAFDQSPVQSEFLDWYRDKLLALSPDYNKPEPQSGFVSDEVWSQ